MTSLNINQSSSSIGVSRFWEKRNPLLRNGRNVGVLECPGLISKLKNQNILASKFIVIVPLMSIVIMAIIIGLAVESITILRLVLSIFAVIVSIGMWNTLINKLQSKIRKEMGVYRNRVGSFLEFMTDLAEHMEIKMDDLIDLSEDEVVDYANEVLYELALDILGHEDAKDDQAKAEDKVYFNTRYDFFVKNGMVPVASYQDFFTYCRWRAGVAA